MRPNILPMGDILKVIKMIKMSHKKSIMMKMMKIIVIVIVMVMVMTITMIIKIKTKMEKTPMDKNQVNLNKIIKFIYLIQYIR